MIACLWLPFNLLFDLWVYLTPTYGENEGVFHPVRSQSRQPQSESPSFLLAALVATIVFSVTLFAFLALPVFTSRLLLILTFGFGFRQYMRLKIS